MKKVVLLREIRGLLKGVYLQREPELINFDTYCRKCKDSRTVEENVVWRVCPVCGEPLIVWNVEEVSA